MHYPRQNRVRSLTSRQNEVLELVLQGKRNKEIAAALNISERTVKFHISNLLNLLGCYGRLELFVAMHPELRREL